MSLLHIIYASAATKPMPFEALTALLRDSRDRNTAAGLTGMLLHAEGSFIQVLEGVAPAVDAAFNRIERDPRHDRITRIIREPIAERAFSDWSMGFHELCSDDLAGILGTNDFFGAGTCLSGLGPVRARKLLTAFARGRWRQPPSCSEVQRERDDAVQS